MKIGIVSDTHGRSRQLRAALAELAGRGAEAIVHCGDVGGAGCTATLGEVGVPVYVVAGNMDRHRLEPLKTKAAELGLHFNAEAIMLPLPDGGYLAATHGNDVTVLERLVEIDRVAYLCHGHTHRRRDEVIGGTRMINPGALVHARGGAASCALLDTETDTLEFIDMG